MISFFGFLFDFSVFSIFQSNLPRPPRHITFVLVFYFRGFKSNSSLVFYSATYYPPEPLLRLKFAFRKPSKMSAFYDEVEIEDFEYDEELDVYTYPCPCGDKFSISTVCRDEFPKLFVSIQFVPF